MTNQITKQKHQNNNDNGNQINNRKAEIQTAD